MDAQIYKLIASAEQEQNLGYLREAFGILDPESQKVKNDKIKSDVENISQNLYVQCAEVAINLNEFNIASKCIQIYFNLPMISNQFLARAYLCQFQLLAPIGTTQLENLDKCIPFLYKAIEFSKQNKRYNFLVYNASVLFWKYIRAFLKHKYKRYICGSLQFILNALNEIDDADYEWRATLTKILIECYIDDEKFEKAAEIAKNAEVFIRNFVPNIYNEFFSFAIKQNLLDETEINELSQTKPHLNAIYKIEKLRARAANKVPNVPSEEIVNEFSELYKFMLPHKSKESTSIPKKDPFDNEFLRQKLLMDLAHVCLLHNEPNISSLIIGYLKERELMNDELQLELEFIECEKSVKELKHKQEKYNNAVVKLRLDAIRRCDELLKNTIRTNNPALIQFGCSIQWNLCLPLLQPGLRKDVRKPLEFLAECLERIESMEWLFRCQVHFEISKCEEEIEQLQVAEQHLVKALKLDDHKIYTDQLNHGLTRLKLKAELYKTPEKLENQVAMILEQTSKADKKNGGGSNKNEINTRSLLLRAADLLAHNEFGHVMDSETYKQGIGKMNEDIVSRLLAKSRNHINCVSKCNSHINDHIKDLENKYQDSSKETVENILKIDYRERLKLWFDLCKIARRQQIWDVCRVASRFCLLYDDEKLINRFIPLNDAKSQLFHKELMRNLAEAHFIKGEALLQFIRGENVELYDKPKPPQLASDNADILTSMNKFQKTRNFETDTEWLEYCQWLKALYDEIIKDFLRGVKIGVLLNESWIVCQGAAYCWNYFHHIFEQKRHSQVNQVLTELLDGIKKVGHNEEAQLVVNICNALAIGLTTPWLPPEQVKTLAVPGQPSADNPQSGNKSPTRKGGKGGSVASGPAAVTNTKGFSLPSDGAQDFKKALEVCEYAMNITNGENLADLVHLKERLPLIKTWVLVKHILQSPIKNFGLQNTSNQRIQDKFTKCLVAVEILDRNTLGYLEIKEAPSIRETIGLVDQASTWPDRLIELQLWCRLAILANRANDTDSLRYSHSKALSSVSYFEKKKSENKTIYLLSQCLLSEVCIALGEHLAVALNPGSVMIQLSTANKRDTSSHTAASSKEMRSTIRREAVNAFADGAGYAAKAENYDLAMHAARQFWNLSLSYLKKPSERALLFENLKEILSSLAVTYKIKKSEEDKNEDEEEPLEKPVGILKNKDRKARPENSAKAESTTKFMDNADQNTSSITSFSKNADAFDDLTLRSALYGCLFQILIDKKDYDEALSEMDKALNEMPRTKHRLLIYRYRIMTKAKLGLDVQMDLQKFREESEKNLAQMYRKVALSSSKHEDIISAYQHAIEALNSEENMWLKFEYLLELAEWLYSNEYKLQNSIDLVEWAADIIFNVKTEKPLSASTSVMSRGSKQTKRGTAQKQISISESATKLQASSMSDILEVKSENGTEYDAFQTSYSGKEALIGALPINKNVQLNDLQDIRQLECLIRANIVLACMLGRSSIEYNHYLIKSYGFLARLLSQGLDNAFFSMKEIQKFTASQNEQATNKKPDVKDKAKDKNKTPEVGAKGAGGLQQKKIKADSTSSSYLPQTIEEWSTFEINDEIIAAWSHELMRKTGINVNTIHEPLLFYHYLDILADMLNQQGFTHYLFLIYNVQLILLKIAIKQKLSFSPQANNQPQFTSLECYTRLKCISLCIELNLINSVAVHQQAIVMLLTNANTNANPAANNAQAQATPTVPTSTPGSLLKLIQLDALEVGYVRDEIYENNQRKAQIAKEEMTNSSLFSSKKSKELIKAQKRQTFADINSKCELQKLSKLKSKLDEEINYPGERKQISNSLVEILYKDVWIKIADLLIKNKYMQNARDFIYESMNTSQNFNDKDSMGKLYYFMGELALFDSKFSEAVNFGINAQKIPIDELFWFKSVLLMARASKLDTDNRNFHEKATAILNRALDVIEKEIQKRSNKLNTLMYIKAMLIYELAKLNYEIVMHKFDSKTKSQPVHYLLEKVNTMRPAVFKVLSQTCKMFENSVEILITEGYKREALPIIKEHAELLKRFAFDCHNIEAKHDYMLQSYILIKEGCKIANEIYFDIQTCQAHSELQNISLPIQRELIDLKLTLSLLLTEILEMHVNEIKEKNVKNLSKTHIVKTFEDYIQVGEELSDTEQEWKVLLSKISDEIFGNLISCHNLSQKVKQLKGKTFYLIGRTLRLLSEYKIQLKSSALQDNIQVSVIPLSKWDTKILELLKADSNQSLHEQQEKVNSKTSKTSPPKASNQSVDLEQSVNISQAGQDSFNDIRNDETLETHDIESPNALNKINEQEYIEKLLTSVNRYDSQSMEYLFQSLNIAFSLDDKELISTSSHELVELTGRFDIQLCSQFISLYQSCLNAIEMESFLQKCLKDPKSSLLASYLHQINSLKETSITRNSLNSPIIVQYMNSVKNKFNALKNLSISPNHLNLSRELPNNYILMILQHDEKKNHLYGAIMDRLKPAANSKNIKQQNNSVAMPPTKAMTIKIDIDEKELFELQHQWRVWKSDLQTYNLKVEFHLNHEMIRKQMLANLNASGTTGAEEQYFASSASKSYELIETERELEARFKMLLNNTEEYLKPITEHFETFFFNLSQEAITANKPNDRVILLADLTLLEFPLETLKLFHNNASICSVSRDFSLQFFYNRLYQDKENADANAATNDDKKKKDAKPAPTKAATTTTGDSLSESSLIIDPSQFNYLVDIYNEATNTVPQEFHPVNSFRTIIQQFTNATTKWHGLCGNTTVSSLGERERMLAESNGLLFYGTERLLSYYQTSKMPSFNLNKCHFLFSNDLSQTNKSSNRISKLDVLKSNNEIQFEQPLHASVILSLTGIKCIASNQWSTTLVENSNKFQQIFKDLLTSPQSIGESIRYKISPHIKLILEQKSKEEENKKTVQEKKDTKKDVAVKKDAAAKSDKKSDREKSPEKKLVTAQTVVTIETTEKDENKIKIENEIKQLQIITKENCNMICYGIPDVYMQS